MTVISGFNDDTVQACRDRSNTGDMVEAYISAAMYVNGMGKPHYPVPAIPARVVWRPRGMYPLCGKHRAYFAVASHRLCWTFWEDFGLIDEYRD